MPRLSATQMQARQQILRLATQRLTPDQLGEAVMTAICRAIPCDAYSLYVVDPDSLLFTRVLAGSDGKYAAGRLHWLRHTYLVRQPGRLNPLGMMHARLPAVGLHEDLGRCIGAAPAFFADSARAWWHRFHEIEGVPFRNVIAGSCAVDGRWVAGLTLVRVDPITASFRETDLAFLRMVSPTIGQAVRAALTHERAVLAIEPVPDVGIGVLALGANGRIQFQNASAAFWIDALRETWVPEAPGVPQLPTAVWSVVAALNAERDATATLALRVLSAQGPVRIEASRGTAGAATIVLAPEPRPAAPHLPDDWPLTPQERRVLVGVAQGLTNRQIAAQIAVSEHTIVSHLAHAYEKLGVHSRTQLLARLFQETYLPAMEKAE